MQQATTPPTESKIQSDCFTYHWNNYPQERMRLFMVYNNPKNRAHGAILKAMGMVAGASDLIYLTPCGKIAFLECKRPGGFQSAEQKEFEKCVKAIGHDYHLFHSLEEFKAIINSYH